ncbi:OmpW family protein [Roseovarius sp. A21]|uniref:OmpW family protein n=1 Tax=Roseovarius bejariae TaxID=2576383 RepID=A0A844CZP8_9RHOB|nr:OmpW family outer membrane protein [Roseovarius bejariae]MRU14348.1 OmpW family protein [Roseovarius bejariae]
MKRLTALTLATALTAVAAPALAQEKGDMLLGLGIGYIQPTDSYSGTPGTPLRVDGNARPTLTFEYFIADNIGIEVLAATPFEHDIETPAGDIGKTKHLPPTVSLQYHFTNNSSMTPFIGAGINYTTFWDDRLNSGAPLKLDDSWGYALHAGIDFAVSEKAAIRTDLRYIDIETDASSGGTALGKVKIDPVVFGVSYVMKF